LGHEVKALTYIYTVIYLLFSAWTIASVVKERDPWWDKAADIILLPLGVIGILLFLFGVSDPSIKSTWRVISILIVAGQLFTNVFSRHLILAGKTDLSPERVSQWAILGADLAVIALLVPMFALNMLFAFS